MQNIDLQSYLGGLERRDVIQPIERREYASRNGSFTTIDSRTGEFVYVERPATCLVERPIEVVVGAAHGDQSYQSLDADGNEVWTAVVNVNRGLHEVVSVTNKMLIQPTYEQAQQTIRLAAQAERDLAAAARAKATSDLLDSILGVMPTSPVHV